jgi:hypothetical protein
LAWLLTQCLIARCRSLRFRAWQPPCSSSLADGTACPSLLLTTAARETDARWACAGPSPS